MTYTYEPGRHAVRHHKYPARPYTIPTREANTNAYPIPDRILPKVFFSLSPEEWEEYKRLLPVEIYYIRQSRGGNKRRIREETEQAQRSASPSSRASFTPGHSGANTPAADSPYSRSHDRSQSRSSRPQLALELDVEFSSRAQSPVWYSVKDSSSWKERSKLPHCGFSASLILTSN
jgi:hypothetical protein